MRDVGEGFTWRSGVRVDELPWTCSRISMDRALCPQGSSLGRFQALREALNDTVH